METKKYYSFRTALSKMKFDGKKMRVKGTKGYWSWDFKTNRIIIHDKDGRDLSAAPDIELVCICALSNNWEEAE